MIHDKKTVELSMLTVRDNVNLALSLTRAGHFNRSTGTEHHCAVVEARLKVLESLGYAEIARLEREDDGAPAGLTFDIVAIKQEMLANLRDRRFIKYLFNPDPEHAGAYGRVDEPLDLDTQEEIVDTLAKIVLTGLSR